MLNLLKLVLSVILLSFFTTTLSAQLEFGVIGGFHSYDFEVSEIDSVSGVRAGIADATFGLHLGVFTRIDLGGFYIEPAAILNNISAKYTVTETGEQVEESNLNVDFPVMLGFEIAILNIFAGPVAHLRFSDYSDLRRVGEYEDNYDKAHFGIQAGAGMDFEKFGLDFRYEKNFNNNDLGVIDTIKELKFVDTNSRIIASITYRF